MIKETVQRHGTGRVCICSCDGCGKIFKRNWFSIQRRKYHFCSYECYGKWKSKNIVGDKNPLWNGGIVIESGYVSLYNPNHPNSVLRGYVKKHRLVMEEHLDRYLTKEEIVHHEDGNKLNNDINNLILFKNQSEHARYHNLGRKKQL